MKARRRLKLKWLLSEVSVLSWQDHILSNMSIDSAKELMKEDPFFINNIADFKYIEFTESKTFL